MSRYAIRCESWIRPSDSRRSGKAAPCSALIRGIGQACRTSIERFQGSMGISTPSPDVVSDLVPRARRPRPRAPWLALAVLLWLPAAAVATIDAARLGAGTTPLCRFLEVTWVEFPCMAGAPP